MVPTDSEQVRAPRLIDEEVDGRAEIGVDPFPDGCWGVATFAEIVDPNRALQAVVHPLDDPAVVAQESEERRRQLMPGDEGTPLQEGHIEFGVDLENLSDAQRHRRQKLLGMPQTCLGR
ncbi:hypothetical protein HGB45_28250 [Nocardia cerradoensis]|nr:hypothetical protein [Nocardia cerradoensis]NKY47268.1 hypothetical protein [Nocardia cerradoensis]